jgi:hypothetical protein
MQGKPPFHRSAWFGGLLSALFILSHLFRLAYHGFWIDEFHTLDSISGSYRQLVANRLSAGHIPTYFLLLKAWTGVSGLTAWSLRFPAVLSGAKAFFTFFLLAREYLPGTRAYAVALTLFFFHPYLLWTSHDARMYALLVGISIVAAQQLLAYVRSGRNRFLLGYGSACVLGLSIHLLFGLQVAAHLIFTAIHYRARLKGYVASLLLPLAIFGPIVLLTVSKAKGYKPGFRLRFPDVWLVVRKMNVLVATDFDEFLRPEHHAIQSVARGLCLVFFLWFLVSGIRHLRKMQMVEGNPEGQRQGQALRVSPEHDLLRFSFYWLGIPALILMVSLDFNNVWVNTPRYYLPSLGAIVAVVAIEMAAMTRSFLRNGMKVAYAAFFGFALVVQLSWKGPGIRESVRLIQQQFQEGDGVIVCNSGVLERAFEFYAFDRAPLLPVDRTEQDQAVLLETIRNFAKNKQRLWVLLHHVEESPLPQLLEAHPEEFTKIEDRTTADTEVQVFRLQNVHG